MKKISRKLASKAPNLKENISRFDTLFISISIMSQFQRKEAFQSMILIGKPPRFS